MKEKFKGLKGKDPKIFAKCIDEYNYIRFTIPALEKKRNKE